MARRLPHLVDEVEGRLSGQEGVHSEICLPLLSHLTPQNVQPPAHQHVEDFSLISLLALTFQTKGLVNSCDPIRLAAPSSAPDGLCPALSC